MEIELAATRFAYWSLSIVVLLVWGVANIRDWLKNDTWRMNPVQISILGIAVTAFGWAAKEHWWWIPEHLRAVGNCGGIDPALYVSSLCERADWFLTHGGFTNYAYVFMFLGEALALNIFTRRYVGG